MALYFFLFPHQIAGPIVRYSHFVLDSGARLISRSDFYIGIERFILGLSKKVLISNFVAYSVDKIFATPPTHLSTILAWLGAVNYTLQIYFDFSGYSDMAIGLARMFGFHFQENFDFPYRSRSVTEFWRRWHISLSSWFRDYLYIPLGGNRYSISRTYINLIIVFFLCGLWHGACWTFVVWGLWHGLFLIIERLGVEKYLSKNNWLSHFWTLGIVVTGWVFFRSESVSFALSFIKLMFSFESQSVNAYQAFIFNTGILGMVLGILFCTGHLAICIKNCFKKVMGLYEILLLLIFMLSLSRLAGATFNPFIYFRF
ncbi:MAG: hypothetical protein K1X29_00415 [Bdellovibrionales bacterium]|nr:hypothetical protein [Bdellovibrionales bacterium]